MQYIKKINNNPESLENWKVEPCSPFEILEAVNNNAKILLWPTSEALGEFFEGRVWNPNSLLNYTVEFPDITPEDTFYFIFCPNPGTFQFWKGHCVNII